MSRMAVIKNRSCALQNTPHWIISAVLAAAFFPIWRSFDGTKGGAILAALLLAGAPIGECVHCFMRGQKCAAITWSGDRHALLTLRCHHR